MGAELNYILMDLRSYVTVMLMDVRFHIALMLISTLIIYDCLRTILPMVAVVIAFLIPAVFIICYSGYEDKSEKESVENDVIE